MFSLTTSKSASYSFPNKNPIAVDTERLPFLVTFLSGSKMALYLLLWLGLMLLLWSFFFFYAELALASHNFLSEYCPRFPFS